MTARRRWRWRWRHVTGSSYLNNYIVTLVVLSATGKWTRHAVTVSVHSYPDPREVGQRECITRTCDEVATNTRFSMLPFLDSYFILSFLSSPSRLPYAAYSSCCYFISFTDKFNSFRVCSHWVTSKQVMNRHVVALTHSRNWGASWNCAGLSPHRLVSAWCHRYQHLSGLSDSFQVRVFNKMP